MTVNVYAVTIVKAIGYPEIPAAPEVLIQPDATSPADNVDPFIEAEAEADEAEAEETLVSLFDSTIKLGFGVNISNVSVSDNIGETETTSSIQFLNFYLTDSFIGGTRYLSEVAVNRYAFDANETYIGQDVSQLNIRFSIQKNWSIIERFSPWWGGGIEFSSSSSSKRHLVDSDGYLIEQYDDEVNGGVNLLFNVMEVWEINSTFDIAAKFEYSFPVTNYAVHRVSIGFVIFFQP